MTEQLHETRDGETLYISFESVPSGRGTAHKYRIEQQWQKDYGQEYEGVTKIIKNIDDSFSAGVGWAIYEAQRTGNHDQAQITTNESIERGVEIHKLIEDYIKYGVVNKSDPAFMNWYNYVGMHTEWVSSELFVIDEICGYGGTVDALSWEDDHYVIHDFKTKNNSSYTKKTKDINGDAYFPKDRCQIAAYARALRNMNSKYYPILEGRIHYIMRDSDLVEVQPVDFGYYEDFFLNSWRLYDIVKRDKYKKQRKMKVKVV